jgi:hypothetical protein
VGKSQVPGRAQIILFSCGVNFSHAEEEHREPFRNPFLLYGLAGMSRTLVLVIEIDEWAGRK